MAAKRGLADAVNDQVVKKESPESGQARNQKNRIVLKICVSLLLGFAGGVAFGRWARLLKII